jgi:hypothetical protein
MTATRAPIWPRSASRLSPAFVCDLKNHEVALLEGKAALFADLVAERVQQREQRGSKLNLE